MDRQLFIRYTCIIEAITGIGLIFLPVKLVSLIFGSALTGYPGISASMVAGIAILSLSFTWWLLRSASLHTVFKTVFFYNAVLSLILIYTVIVYKIEGPVIWIIIIFHLLQSFLSAMQLNRKKVTDK